MKWYLYVAILVAIAVGFGVGYVVYRDKTTEDDTAGAEGNATAPNANLTVVDDSQAAA